jgi:hypothetical protein
LNFLKNRGIKECVNDRPKVEEGMKKRLLAGMILCIATFCGLEAQGMTIIKIKVQLANVRSEPDTNAPIIKQLKSGTLLEASQKLGDWFEITVQDDQGKTVFGYINQSVVDVVSGGKPGEPAVKVPERKEPVVDKEPVIQKEPEKTEAPAAAQSGAARAVLGGFKIMGSLASANMTYNAQENKSVIDSSNKPRGGFGGGLGYERGGSLIGFEIDLLYLPKGALFKGDLSGITFDLKFSLDEVSVPFLLKLNVLRNTVPNVYLLAGGEIAFILQSELVYKVQISEPPIDSSGTEDIKKNLKPLDYGLVLGAGASLPLGGISVFIEGRYHLGMAELEEEPGDYETLVTGAEKFLSKSRLLLVMLGIRF